MPLRCGKEQTCILPGLRDRSLFLLEKGPVAYGGGSVDYGGGS